VHDVREKAVRGAKAIQDMGHDGAIHASEGNVDHIVEVLTFHNQSLLLASSVRHDAEDAGACGEGTVEPDQN